jgi:hypothetical protein
MNFTVVWVGSAERKLADIWLAANDRAGVTQSARVIERELASHPDAVGESRDLVQRVLFLPPLGVRYEVSMQDRLARILHVWHITSRK